MRAPRTHKVLKVDVSCKYGRQYVFSCTDMVRLFHFNGGCVVGMYEIVQSRNLGDPTFSKMDVGMLVRNGMQALAEEKLEVGLLHSTREVR